METQAPNDLQKTNDPPDAVTRQLYKAKRSRLQHEIALADAEIVKLQEKRFALALEQQLCSEILSPVRLLPVDVLLEIFNNFLPSGQTSLLDFSRVCRGWRNAVLNMSSLWAELVLPGPGYSESAGLQHLEEHVRNCLDRARGRPISLTINALPNSVLEPLLESIFQKPISRWAKIIITASQPQYVQRVLTYYETYPEEIPALSSFGIKLLRPKSNTRDEPTPTFQFDLNNLKALRALMVFDHRKHQADIALDWGKLTSLTLSVTASCERHIEIITQCPNLEHLDLELELPRRQEAQNISQISLLQLKKFAIKANTIPSGILRNIKAPNLQGLVFDFPGPTPMSREEDYKIYPFLQHLSDSLRVFRCSGSTAGAILNHPAFQSVTNLTLLEPFGGYGGLFRDWEADDPEFHIQRHVFELLAFEKYYSIMPALRYLEVVKEKLEVEELLFLAQVIQSRLPETTPEGQHQAALSGASDHRTLRRVWIQQSKAAVYECVEWDILSQLRAEGEFVVNREG